MVIIAHFSRRMVIIAPSSPASTDSDTESVGKVQLIAKSRRSDKIKRKAVREVSPQLPRAALSALPSRRGQIRLPPKRAQIRTSVWRLMLLAANDVCLDIKKNAGTLVGTFSLGPAPARNDPFPATERITELEPIEDTDLKTKRSSVIRICEEQLEQSEEQQEDQTPPGQADSLISQVEACLSRPCPPLFLPLASEARPSSSPVSHPSQGMSDQTQATPDRAPELSFPFAPSSSRTFRTESLMDMPTQSNISAGACLPKAMNLLEKEGLGGHDRLYDNLVRHLISGIDGIGELKRRYDLCAGEQASRLKETEDIAIMLRKQVEELEAKVSMANMSERRLMDMLCKSEDGHAGTKRELALTREKMNEADRRIEYLEAAVSRYQNRIAVAEVEKEKAEERACRASVEAETMSTPHPSPAAPRSTSLSFVPSPSPRLTDLEVYKESALFPEITHLDPRQKISGFKLFS